MSCSKTDADWMSDALNLARQGLFTTGKNPRVGCVIVKDHQQIAEGWHQFAGQRHAEAEALYQCQVPEKLRGATAYVTLEPCSHHGKTPPCADALIQAGVSRVVIGHLDPNPQVNGQGATRLREAGIDVETGVLEHACRSLNPGFIQRFEQGRPYVRVKIACSLDGKIALKSGESQWITNAQAREDTQRYRARSDAIISGSGTFYMDNPSFTVRPQTWRHGQYPDVKMVRQPDRIIVSRYAPKPNSFSNTLFTDSLGCIWASHERSEAMPAGVDHWPLSEPKSALSSLYEKLVEAGYNELWFEAGPKLTSQVLRTGWWDELIVYQAPVLLGEQAINMVDFTLDRLVNAVPLQLIEQRWVGDNQRLRFTPKM
ncbi:MAG: bifunctional diaminohydroxyphosphoribosylaminopyrimidine deaminase/5-amino-6-(5-phosphoribosylamino)uracil reductase RibD [Pseudomonadota bacterium]|nr:bifunctional diaminohydroxyphosphoribosylaminopyrimidine deaminase/5-amino-6-(5-phosphoribosylamino)uracil reductase RibD [Pseudomonadota bacterium]